VIVGPAGLDDRRPPGDVQIGCTADRRGVAMKARSCCSGPSPSPVRTGQIAPSRWA